MTLSIAAFALVFGVGPALYLQAVRLPQGAVIWLLAGMAICVGIAIWAWTLPTENSAVLSAALASLWAGWLCGCAAVILALRSRFEHRQWRIVRTLGAITTTAPWFGFAAARLGVS
ncbi:MAG: hypothetical protein AAF218_01285 [Pseudomonadota bacterium]